MCSGITTKAVNELNIEIGILQNECQLQIENARNN